jgi:Kef-type K+ transport system membrane component KefB
VVADPIIGILALWFAARALGTLAQMLKLPSVVGELAAGVLFSPSFLGHKFHVASPLLTTASFYAGIGFLFLAGFENQLSTLKDRIRAGLAVAITGAAVPFLFGWIFANHFPALFGYDAHTSPAIFELFLGVSFAISALPVLTRTLMDVGVYHSTIGSVTLSAAILENLVVWIAFSALFATSIHFHLPALALVVGVAVGEIARKRSLTVRKTANWLSVRALSPLFFSVVGLKLGNLAQFDLMLTLLLIAVATVGKLVVGTLTAKLNGISTRESWCVGFAMNSRGAMSIFLSTLGHELGMISDRLFLALIIMALFTSIVSGPALRQILKPSGPGWN